jgi:hypothetical protein
MCLETFYCYNSLALCPISSARVEAQATSPTCLEGTRNYNTPLQHPATSLVRHLATTGFPAHMTTPPWTLAQRDQAVQRGPHNSAHLYREFLRDELADMVDRATWVVLPYHQLRHVPNLRVSPMGVVPQHERRPRPIVDYSFSGVNSDTMRIAPVDAMQFGRALERIITQVVHSNPRFGPVQFFKVDIADGFYRVWLQVEHVPTLAVTIPSLPHEPHLLALPLALPMGWTQSPPAFCAVTETIADLANQRLRRHGPIPRSHRLEHLADSPSADAIATPSPRPIARSASTAVALPPTTNPLLRFYQRPTRAFDVFVDDFIAVAQGTTPSLRRTRRILLDTIDQVLRPLSPTDPPYRTEPISTSKLAKGDGAWSTCKKLLGWIVDSASMTLTLPARRLARLHELLNSIPPSRKRLSLTTWFQLLGELRSMALALPGARGLFSHLQQVLHLRQGSRLRLTPSFHQALDDFRWLHNTLGSRPTRLYELVPTTPCVVGTHDASGLGAGGVWLPHPTTVPRSTALRTAAGPPSHSTVGAPILWRTQFPVHVGRALRTFDTPHGTLNNSELELVGAYLHDDVAAQCFDIRERTIRSDTDNLAALFWYRRGSITTSSPTATLLRQHALHQRFHRYLSLKDYVPGVANSMADDASRLWHLSDSALLTYFDSRYPQPLPWHMYRPPSAMVSSAISALHRRPSPRALFLRTPPPPVPTGASGLTTVTPYYASILPFKQSKTLSLSSKSSPIDTVPASSTPAGVPSAAVPWKAPYAALAKRLPVWGPRTHVSPPKVPSTSG